MAQATEERLISTGGLAARIGRSPSTIKYFEAAGVIPPAVRVEGSNRRVWRDSDVAVIEDLIGRRTQRQPVRVSSA